MRFRDIETPFGVLSLTELDGAITALRWGAREQCGASSVLDQACAEIVQYVEGKRQVSMCPCASMQRIFRLRSARKCLPSRSVKPAAMAICPRSWRHAPSRRAGLRGQSHPDPDPLSPRHGRRRQTCRVFRAGRGRDESRPPAPRRGRGFPALKPVGIRGARETAIAARRLQKADRAT